MDPTEQALVTLGRELQTCDYHFTTITPASHYRVNTRRANGGQDALRRAFGWSRCFRQAELPRRMVALLEQAGELASDGGRLRSKVRFSTLGSHLLVHSAFPTEAPDTVFFGPDTYRFARTLRQALRDFCRRYLHRHRYRRRERRWRTLRCRSPRKSQPDIILADINTKALRYSRVNAALNRVRACARR